MELNETQKSWLAENGIREHGKGFAKGHWARGLQYNLEPVSGGWVLRSIGLCTQFEMYAPVASGQPDRKFKTLKAGLACLRTLEVR